MDESKYSIVACVWAGKHTELLPKIRQSDVIVVVSARISDFSGKSLNVSEDA